jgi:hypothetical protein
MGPVDAAFAVDADAAGAPAPGPVARDRRYTNPMASRSRTGQRSRRGSRRRGRSMVHAGHVIPRHVHREGGPDFRGSRRTTMRRARHTGPGHASRSSDHSSPAASRFHRSARMRTGFAATKRDGASSERQKVCQESPSRTARLALAEASDLGGTETRHPTTAATATTRPYRNGPRTTSSSTCGVPRCASRAPSLPRWCSRIARRNPTN